MKHFLLFGSHPELSLAEARAVLDNKVDFVGGALGIVDQPGFDAAAMQERLAGTVKLGEVVAEIEPSDIPSLASQIADQIEARPRADRVLFGLTLIGSPKDKARHKKLPIELKRALQERGRSVRWVTGDEGEISPAAVAKLKLTTEGYDFVIALGKKITLGLTTQVQNADRWSERDYGRPFRDAKTGMLPPKLARMMVNLSSISSGILLDPFCGGGTVLMEAAMLFPSVELIGSDIDAKQVSGTKRNFEWLKSKNFVEKRVEPKLITSSAQNIDDMLDEQVDAIVTEGYLGKALSGNESPSELQNNKREVEKIWIDSLPALGRVLKPGGRLVCVWPAFVTPNGPVNTGADAAAKAAGLSRVIGALPYGRADQRLVRNLFIYEKIEQK
jgi:tRNA G10  N-methylase Trm11